MIVNTYKLMINPLCINSFIQFNNGKFSENITNRREVDCKILMSILNQKHFYNVNILYPIFVGENQNENKNNYVHLIPVDHQTHEIKIQSFFDSCVYNYNCYDKSQKLKFLSLFTLSEGLDNGFSISEYLIKNPLFIFDTNKKSNIIIEQKQFNLSEKYNLKNSIQKISNGDFITELKIFQDEQLIYILSKGGYISISKENHNIIEEKMFKIAHSIGLLNRVVPVYDKTFKEICYIK